jgi:hypothetical protein
MARDLRVVFCQCGLWRNVIQRWHFWQIITSLARGWLHFVLQALNDPLQAGDLEVHEVAHALLPPEGCFLLVHSGLYGDDTMKNDPYEEILFIFGGFDSSPDL